MNLNELRDKAYKIACEHGFHDTELSNKHFLCLIISELMEAVEADRGGKRLIQFICCPDKYLKNKESLKQRKAEGRYKPTKAEWAATIREHRRYKEQLKKKGDIK